MPGPTILKYPVTSVFGDPDTVGGRRRGNHKGADFATPEGTNLDSPIDGTVIAAGKDAAMGNYVIIQGRSGTVTLLHGKRVLVKPGQRVRAGDLVFTSGNTGASTGPHTELRWQDREGRYIDPLPILKRASTSKPPGMAAPLAEDPDLGEDEIEPGTEPPIDLGEETDDLKGTDLIKRGLGQISILNKLKTGSTLPGSETEGPRLSRGMFTATNRTDSPENLLRNFQGFSGLSDEEAEYSLPFLDEEIGGPGRAVRNILRSLGHTPEYANPYTQFLEKRLTRRVMPTIAQQALEGNMMDQRQLAERLVASLQSGRNLDQDGFFKALNALPEDPNELIGPQRLITQLLGNPATARQIALDASGLSGDMRTAMGRAYDVGLEEYLNKAQPGGRGYIDFLRQQMR